MPSFGVPLEPPVETLEELTQACVAFIAEHVRTLADQPSFDLEGAGPLVESFREPAPERGRALPELLARLAPAIGKSFNTAGPGYLAFIPGGGLPTAALGDYVALSVNRYVGVTRAAPALAEIEAVVLRWLAGEMGYPASARGILTSGGSLSNLVAIVTAREARLGEDFQSGVIYLSEETHVSVAKAARLAGFPARALRFLPCDARLRLDVDALADAVRADRAAGRRPFCVVANVGTTNTGAVDPLPEMVSLAARERLWVHADAAYGGFFRLAPGGDALMPGLGDCDSITLDPHKGLFLPYGTGCILVRDGQALAAAHRAGAAYLRDVSAAPGEENFADLSPELSREFRGLRLWLPIQLHGLAAFRGALAEKLQLARLAYDQLAQSGRFELMGEPQLSVVAFRAAGRDDAAQAELLRRVNERRRVFLSSTVLGDRLTLRLCVLSFRTHEDRIREAVDALVEEARRL
jgi:aromatic-L-amino-acid decarboxylase